MEEKDTSIVLWSFHNSSAPCVRTGSDRESVIWDDCGVLRSADTPGQGRYGTGGKGRRCGREPRQSGVKARHGSARRGAV